MVNNSWKPPTKKFTINLVGISYLIWIRKSSLSITFAFLWKTEPTRTFTQDGVCLTELGLSQLQSLSVAPPRRKRPKPKLKLKIISQNSVAVLQTPPPDPQSEQSRDLDGDMDDSRGTIFWLIPFIN